MAKSKTKTVYACQNCGAQRPKWVGQCSDCKAWNSFVEEVYSDSGSTNRGWALGTSSSTGGVGGGSGAKPSSPAGGSRRTKSVTELISASGTNPRPRITTGIGELDRVLGGGTVPGSFILLGGDPGIGKSTLLLQMAGGLAVKGGAKVLYVSGEESLEQTSLRAQRLGVTSPQIEVAAESQLETITEIVRERQPDVLIVDSIQTIFRSDVPSAPGSVAQVRESAGALMVLAKNEGVTIFLIGHVTKDGSIAGPKTLEHMVDTVLSFEGDISHQFRLLRALKNRFGATHELGVFQMNSRGLEEVANPSELFLEERAQNVAGSTVVASLEGSRPLLCEVQALCVYTPLAIPRRTSIGWDLNRLHLLVAVLDKHLDLELSTKDIFVNVVGGLKLTEPAADLGMAAAIISSQTQREIHPRACFFGEVGLTGEVRAVSFAEARVREAAKLGFEVFVLPASCKKQLTDLPEKLLGQIRWISHLRELPKFLGGPTNTRQALKEKVFSPPV